MSQRGRAASIASNGSTDFESADESLSRGSSYTAGAPHLPLPPPPPAACCPRLLAARLRPSVRIAGPGSGGTMVFGARQ